jgi:DNA-binding NtrC family response regulator
VVHRDTTAVGSGSEARGLFLRIFTGVSSADIELTEGNYVLGRGASADIRIDHPSVSRAHLRLSVGAHVLVEDLGSANGTWLAGRRLERQTRVLFAAGMPLELGDALVLLRHGREGTPTVLQSQDGTTDVPAADRVRMRIARAALPVLVLGEKGAGKRYAARRIHGASGRAEAPLVTLDCASLRWTGADVPAAFEEAKTGSLLLEEVAELDPAGQAKVLTACGTITRREGPRLIATTSSNIEELVATGLFRGDLYHRLAHLTLVVPPLRARLTELPDLCAALLAELASELEAPAPLLSSDALRTLSRHHWPANVSELRRELARAFTSSGSRVLTASHFSDLGAKSPPSGEVASMPVARAATPPLVTTPNMTRTLRDATEQAEYAQILDALRACSGNQTRAAKLLGISRGTLISRLDRYGVPRPRRPT